MICSSYAVLHPEGVFGEQHNPDYDRTVYENNCTTVQQERI